MNREKRLDRWIRSKAMRVTNHPDTVGEVRRTVFRVGLAVFVALGLAFGAGVMFASKANASNGGLAADGCHKLNEKIDGKKVLIERHWHLKPENAGGKKRVRGGPCVKDSAGKTHKLGSNAICAQARIAIANDKEYDGWVKRTNARALVKCVQGLPAPAPEPSPRR